MAKVGMRQKDMSAAGKRADASLAGALLKIIAVGVAGGAVLISGSKKVGEKIKEK